VLFGLQVSMLFFREHNISTSLYYNIPLAIL